MDKYEDLVRLFAELRAYEPVLEDELRNRDEHGC